MDKRKSSRVIVFSKEDSNKIYLIYRNKNGEKYYVVPGGGVEEGESFEQAAIRESMEELGTELYNLKEITKVELDNDICAIFTANELNKFEPTGEELKNLDPNNYYEVQLHNITDINKLKLKPDFYQSIISDLIK